MAAVRGFVRNANTDGPQGKDVQLGFIVDDEEMRNILTGAAPVIADVDRLVVAILPTTGAVQVFTIAAQPDVPRNVTMDLTDADSTVGMVKALVKGKDYWYNDIFERLETAPAGGTQQIKGQRIFRSVSSITAVTTGAPAGADRVAFGVGTGLGLKVRIGDITDIKAYREDANSDTVALAGSPAGTGVTINPDGSAIWVPTTVPDSTNKYFATIKSTYVLP